MSRTSTTRKGSPGSRNGFARISRRFLFQMSGCQSGGYDALPVITTLISPSASSSWCHSGRRQINPPLPRRPPERRGEGLGRPGRGGDGPPTAVQGGPDRPGSAGLAARCAGPGPSARFRGTPPYTYGGSSLRVRGDPTASGFGGSPDFGDRDGTHGDGTPAPGAPPPGPPSAASPTDGPGARIHPLLASAPATVVATSAERTEGDRAPHRQGSAPKPRDSTLPGGPGEPHRPCAPTSGRPGGA